MKEIFLIYSNESARSQSGGLGAARLVPALQAAGASVQVHLLGQGRDAVLDAVANGAMPVVVKAKR